MKANTGRGAIPAARLTTQRALALPTPEKGYRITWCRATPGFGVRVTAAGARAWITERRDTSGKTIRRTLGSITGRGAITDKVARDLALDVSSEISRGIDRLEVRRAARAERKKTDDENALTFGSALRQYVKEKRRGKDGLALKARTQSDYLAMIDGNRISERTGRPIADGELFTLVDIPLARVSADDIRSVYHSAAKRSERRATYAAQVLRAVLNWHGVKVAGNPLSKEVAGKDRITLKPTTGDPRPIPPERLKAWWRAASDPERSRESADYFRLMLLTGMRPGEVSGLTVADVDLAGPRINLKDTKNRKPHTVHLSKQATAVVSPHLKGKKRGALVFDVQDPRKTLQAINQAAETSVTPHDLRKTFASVAEELVSAYALKAMLNHTHGADVTGAHYVAKSESQLRAAWQLVADAIAGNLK